MTEPKPTLADAPADPELIVFGGAFDPPHAAHVALAAAALARFPAAELWVLPGAAPAVAGGGAKETSASFEHRLAMTRLAFAPLEPRVSVLPLEEQLPRPNFTVATLHAVQAQAPGRRLGLLLGLDQVAAFSRWRAPDEILDLATLVIVDRQAPTAAPDGLTLAAALATLYDALPIAARRTHVLTGVDAGPQASRVIRATLQTGQTLPKGWLPEPVRTYIRHQALYGVNTNS